MTRKEFSEKFETYMKVGARRSMLVMGTLCLAMISVGILSDFIEKHYDAKWTDNATAIFMLTLLFCGAIVIVLLDRPMVRKFGLMCPTCGRRLIDTYARGKALLTGHCFKCGNKVFDEEPAGHIAMSCGLDREEFRVKLEDFKRHTNRKFFKLLVLALAAIIASVPITKYFQRLVDSGGLDWVTLTQWNWFAGLMLGSVCLAAVGIFIFALKGKLRVHTTLPCPECSRSLIGGAGKVVIETGMCVYCGCRLFEVPETNHNSTSL